jgi:putative NIF3 family GTP cyclohydrolase 1 type 2
MERRTFLTLAAAGLAGALSEEEIKPAAEGSWTVQEVIDRIMAEIPPPHRDPTVDTLKIGSPEQRVSGIATTFLATVPVIERTAELGANLLIVHEPLYFNHLDEVDWLSEDPVYEQKRELLEDKGIAVWRFHDHWHQVEPDPVREALAGDLGLTSESEIPGLYTIAPTSLEQLARTVKEKLGLPAVRIVGNPEMTCRAMGILPGAFDSRLQIKFLAEQPADVLLIGETNEWETNIWVEDARALGFRKSLLILGHSDSEEPGMRILVPWLQKLFPGLPVQHVPTPQMFRYV